jgi:hypothetical protein
LEESKHERAEILASGVSYDAFATKSLTESNTQFCGSSAVLVKVKTNVRWPLAL